MHGMHEEKDDENQSIWYWTINQITDRSAHYFLFLFCFDKFWFEFHSFSNDNQKNHARFLSKLWASVAQTEIIKINTRILPHVTSIHSKLWCNLFFVDNNLTRLMSLISKFWLQFFLSPEFLWKFRNMWKHRK